MIDNEPGCVLMLRFVIHSAVPAILFASAGKMPVPSLSTKIKLTVWTIGEPKQQ
jgi:hypothetical protein